MRRFRVTSLYIRQNPWNVQYHEPGCNLWTLGDSDVSGKILPLQQTYGWPLNNTRFKGADLCTVENQSITYGQLSTSEIPLLWWFSIWQSYSTIVFTIEKYPHVSGPMEFKPMLFKGPLLNSGARCWQGGRLCLCTGRGIWEISLYLALNYAVNLKIFKNNYHNKEVLRRFVVLRQSHPTDGACYLLSQPAHTHTHTHTQLSAVS